LAVISIVTYLDIKKVSLIVVLRAMLTHPIIMPSFIGWQYTLLDVVTNATLPATFI
jgi:hypothetical protein